MASQQDRHVVYVIPAYNEGKVIARVLQDLQREGAPGTPVVVDDCSADDTSARARSAGAVVLRHLVNRGQGAALQTGFDAAVKLGADYVITYDADGQHTPADTHVMLDALDESGADIALGSRFLGRTSNMPTSRRLLLRAALLFTRVVSRIQVTDTHNGFRAIRTSVLPKLRISEDRMAHASELLDLIAAEQIKYIEVPCHIRYTDHSMQKGQRWHAALPIAFDFLLGRMMR